ncbi:MAG: hypothetical protein DRI54_01050 [Bacteroidetes bacterium]|nr:MAG: hypothetical protein DRI54_01050 [Bacteroidota bacterium]
MDKSHLFEVYEDLDKRNVVLSFKGDLTSDLLTSILHVIEQKLDRYNEPTPVKRKVFNVLVECLQNLYLHSNINEQEIKDKPSVIVMVAKSDNGYNILTGNVIAKESVKLLSERLTNINRLTKEELKQLYLETLTDGKRSSKGGGGLGFLEIARKSKQKLEFGFVPNNDKTSFFSLNVKITQ